ncbi:PKHA2 protein, partial [Polypterus senegalus]
MWGRLPWYLWGPRVQSFEAKPCRGSWSPPGSYAFGALDLSISATPGSAGGKKSRDTRSASGDAAGTSATLGRVGGNCRETPGAHSDRHNRICGFLDIEENDSSNKFQRRYFLLDTQENFLFWYMDNPQVSEATAKQKPKAEFCFVINALSRRYFLQANDKKDLQEWVDALNRATKITVPKVNQTPACTEVKAVAVSSQPKKQQVAYKTEIVGGVVVHTPINPNEDEEAEGREPLPVHTGLKRCQSHIPFSSPSRPGVIKSGYCVKQGNVADSPEDMHSWIKAINTALQQFRGPVKDSFSRTLSLHRYRTQNFSKQTGEEKKSQLVKSSSIASSWQPWTPITPSKTIGTPGNTILEEVTGQFSSLPLQSTQDDVESQGKRRRHYSQPGECSGTMFPSTLDADGMRTTDV